MNLKHLDNLVKTGNLKAEPFDEGEFKGLLHSGEKRLKDAHNKTLSIESRFDLAYNAAHAFALAALRKQEYRPTNRYIVFQALEHTLGVTQDVWRILMKCHENRNLAEYEGHFEVDQQLLKNLLAATEAVRDRINTHYQLHEHV